MAKIDLVVLSTYELSQITDWADPILVEWINFTRNLALVNNQGGDNTDQIAQNTDDLAAHVGSRKVHGVAGNVVGTEDVAQSGTAGVVLLAVDVTDGVDSTVSVNSPDATDLATVITLANEMKGDVNTLVGDLNNAISQLNNLMDTLRDSGVLGLPVILFCDAIDVNLDDAIDVNLDDAVAPC